MGSVQAVAAEELPEDDTTPSAPAAVEDSPDDAAPATPDEGAESLPVDDPSAAPAEALNFQIAEIGGHSGSLQIKLNVKKLYVDTSKADAG
ncbi:hypothetical protein [Streptomyces flavofungini]|uniref:hypothetical protein n=1 Tax=Streptomyces flavofungini TaxID=68200 RepID=UPI0025B09987|nr:hypothetical protein [Streptomyces flavofungini]WJV48580.1 hypothetical protein QUY26_25520 [Streptomyces flavofungini]